MAEGGFGPLGGGVDVTVAQGGDGEGEAGFGGAHGAFLGAVGAAGEVDEHPSAGSPSIS